MSKTQKKNKFKESKFYHSLVKLLNDLKPMTWGQRIEHIWSYYKEYIGLAILGIVVLVGLTTSIISAQKDIKLTGILVNVTMEQEGYNYLTTDYLKSRGWEDEDLVKMQNAIFEDLEINPSEDNYAAAQIVIAEVAAKKLDYMILDELGARYYGTQEVYMDLREFFTEEELKALLEKGLLEFCLEEECANLTDEEVQELHVLCLEYPSIDYCWPATVKITDLAYVKDNVTIEGDVYFAVSGSTEHMDEVRNLWKYMNDWKAK